MEKLGFGIDELGVCLATAESFICDDVFQERNIRLHAPDTEFAQGAVHSLAGHRKIAAHRCDFHEHRVIVGRYYRARIARGGVQTNAETSGRAVVENSPIVRREIFLRVFSGHPTLDGETDARDLILRRNRDFLAEK